MLINLLPISLSIYLSKVSASVCTVYLTAATITSVTNQDYSCYYDDV